MVNSEVGKLGEQLAAMMLVNKGYNIIERNYRCKYGELDIIAMYKGIMAFVEVKTRISDSCGRGCESVTAIKRSHIKNCARCFLYTKGHIYEPLAVEFQVIEINVNHLERLEF